MRLTVFSPLKPFSFAQVPHGTLEPFWNFTRSSPRDDAGWSVAVDNDGSVYLVGLDRVANATCDAFLCKLTQDGALVWNVTWDGGFDDKAYIATVKDGYVYVGGATYLSFSPTMTDMFILKYHASNGSLVWSRTWNGTGNGYDEVDGLVVNDNNLYVAGWTTGGDTQNDFAILKYDLEGNLIWNNTWGTSVWDEANGQICVDETYVYAVGRYNAPNYFVGGDAVLAAFRKTDGSHIWNKTWGGSGVDDAFGMATDDSSLYSVGVTASSGGDAIFLLKYDKTGQLLWNQTWGGSNSEITRAVDVNVNSSAIYVAGNTMSYGNGDFDVVLLRYDQNGNLTLCKTWGGSQLDTAHGIELFDSFVYIAGETRSLGVGDADAFLIKTDLDGLNLIPEFSPLGLVTAFGLVALTLVALRKKFCRKLSSPPS
jgi:hypothetical protein